MTPQEFRAIRKRLGLTQAELARWLEYGSVARVSEIENGKVALPRLVAQLMRAYDGGFFPAPPHADTESRSARHVAS